MSHRYLFLEKYPYSHIKIKFVGDSCALLSFGNFDQQSYVSDQLLIQKDP